MQQPRKYKRQKCLTCNSIGRFKDGLCYWCRRKNMFNKGFLKLNTGEPYSYKTANDLRNYRKCSEPDCEEQISNGVSTNYCILHRVKNKLNPM